MTDYKNLFFFNKLGQNCNFEFDTESNQWIGNLFLPKVSTNLYEVESLFIVEKFVTTNSVIKYGKPHISDPSATNKNIQAEWYSDSTLKIFLFQFNQSTTSPTIENIDTLEIELDLDPTETLNIDELKITDVINNEPISLYVAINSDEEDIYERVLLLRDLNTGNIFAQIKFYGETVDEDERLKVLTKNLGYDFIANDLSMFKESDIYEELSDNIILNEKRKEILLEGHKIVPYIGSYKALINSIKYFGYNDLVIKEYWKNINIYSSKYGKYIPNKSISIKDNSIKLNDAIINDKSDSYRKTNMFNLSFRINRHKEGYYDEYDIPITEESFDYTIEEALIKFMGLQKILKNHFLPLNARILDITAEADYFTKIKEIVLPCISERQHIDVGIHPKFKVLPSTSGYVIDLRNIEDLQWPENTGWNIPHDFRELIQATDITLGDISNVLLAYFQNYYPNLNTVEQFPDKEGIPVGYPIVLENTSFDITWDNSYMLTWNNLDTDANHIYDFEPISVTSYTIFKISETISGQEIEYQAQPGDTSKEISENLVVLWWTKITSDGLPWERFYPTVVETDLGYAVRVKGINVASQQIHFNFVTSVDNIGSIYTDFKTKNISLSNMYTWDSILRGSFYDIEWTVFKSADTTPEFYHNVRGAIADYEVYPVNLPYVGEYTIELKLYDTFNHMSYDIKYNHITVEDKESDFIGFYKYRNEKYEWKNANTSWDKYGSYWDLPLVQDTIWNNCDLSWYDVLDRANSLPNNIDPKTYIQTFTAYDEISYPGPYFWDNLTDGLWNDTTHLWWDSTDVSGDSNTYFKITNIYYGSDLILDDGINTHVHTFKCYDLINAATELNNSKDTIFSRYVYNAVLDENNEVKYILAVAKFAGKGADINSISGTPGKVIIEKWKNSRVTNPTWDNLNLLDTYKILKPFTYISFSYDKCKIPGKTKPLWTIKNNTNDNFSNIYFNQKQLNYMFTENGNYTISLAIEDTNGNRKQIDKNLIIIE